MTMKYSRGFSMIEVLVSIVILSIALLGTAGLMSSSLRNTNTAYYRSQATVLADGILDRMRANLSAVRAGDYRIADGPAYVAATGTVARFDCEEWIATLQSTLPDGGGRVEMIGAVEDGLVRIEVHWNDETEMFRTESRL